MRRTSVGGMVLVVLLAGCGHKIDRNSSFELRLFEDKMFIIEPTKSEQKIQVAGTATGAPVSAYIYLQKNKAAVDKEILALRPSPQILNNQEKTEAIDLEATIPANEAAIVQIIGTGKTAKVQLKITNR